MPSRGPLVNHRTRALPGGRYLGYPYRYVCRAGSCIGRSHKVFSLRLYAAEHPHAAVSRTFVHHTTTQHHKSYVGFAPRSLVLGALRRVGLRSPPSSESMCDGHRTASPRRLGTSSQGSIPHSHYVDSPVRPYYPNSVLHVILSSRDPQKLNTQARRVYVHRSHQRWSYRWPDRVALRSSDVPNCLSQCLRWTEGPLCTRRDLCGRRMQRTVGSHPHALPQVPSSDVPNAHVRACANLILYAAEDHRSHQATPQPTDLAVSPCITLTRMPYSISSHTHPGRF